MSQSAPAVDEGDVPGLAAFLRRELRPTPGRFIDSLRIVAMVLIVVGIAEVFRLPDIALSAYIVLFLSHREAVSTVLSAVISGAVALTAISATILIFMLSLSEPALRIPLMAVATFAAAFLARSSSLGPVFFTGGFIVAYGLTFGDELVGLALQPATSGNAPQLELPEIVFASPEEALVLTLLWMSVAVAMPLAVLIAANLLTGRDPARLLRDALAERRQAQSLINAAALAFAGDSLTSSVDFTPRASRQRLPAAVFRQSGARGRALEAAANITRQLRFQPSRAESSLPSQAGGGFDLFIVGNDRYLRVAYDKNRELGFWTPWDACVPCALAGASIRHSRFKRSGRPRHLSLSSLLPGRRRRCR
jgi:hypothetical protein